MALVKLREAFVTPEIKNRKKKIFINVMGNVIK